MNYLLELADQLDRAERLGNTEDIPEGTRYIQISATMARKIAQGLRIQAQAQEGLEADLVSLLEWIKHWKRPTG